MMYVVHKSYDSIVFLQYRVHISVFTYSTTRHSNTIYEDDGYDLAKYQPNREATTFFHPTQQ